MTLDTDDLVITGVSTDIDNKDTKETYISGNEGYMFDIENPFFAGIEKTMVDYLGSRLIGIKIRKFSGDHVADPTIEAYDLAYIMDRKQNVYRTIITDVDFTFFGYTNISNSAESTIRNSSQYYSNISKAVVEARKNTEKQISDYDLAVQQMTSIMANSLGMFQTVEKTENGGEIVYQHNKPTLEESDIIWKKSEAGFVVSTNGGKTWNAGIDASGNAVVNVLSAIGISFDWANGGTLTLGGSNNTNGSAKILDASGKEIVMLDNTGITATKGTFSGELSAATGTFKGSLSAATGTFSGELSAAKGTFTGTLTNTSGTHTIKIYDGFMEFQENNARSGYVNSRVELNGTPGLVVAGRGLLVLSSPYVGVAGYVNPGTNYSFRQGQTKDLRFVTNLTRNGDTWTIEYTTIHFEKGFMTSA